METIDAAGHRTRFDYDAIGRLSAVHDALGGSTRYTYDPRGLLLERHDANGHTQRYTYDAGGVLIQVADALGRATRVELDANSNVVRLVDPDGTATEATYDAEDRITSVDYADGQRLSLGYDRAGRRTSMHDELGTTTLSYDQLGRVILVSQPFDQTVAYGYDAQGNRTQLTYPDGRSVAYDYDPRDRLTTVRDWLGGEYGYEYDALGRAVAAVLANGARWQAERDLLGRVTRLRHANADGDTLADFTYVYDALGNVIAEGEARYAYDALSRLVAAGRQEFAYDAVGNRVSVTSEDGRLTRARYDAADQLIEVERDGGDVEHYAYDASGNVVARTRGNEQTTFRWDAAGRLRQVGEHRYDYDGAGNLYRIHEPRHDRRFSVDLAAPLPTVLTANGDRFVYGLGRLAAIGAAEEYVVGDIRGSVRGRVDAHGQVATTHEYDPWGVASGAAEPFGYTGELQPDSLVFLRARWYEPANARFLARDPMPGRLGLTASQHPYVYAQANPTTLIDPSGLAAAWAMKMVDAPFPGLPPEVAAQDAVPGWVNFLEPSLPGDPVSAMNTIMGVLAKARVTDIDRLYETAAAAWEQASKLYGKAAGLFDRAMTPSSSLLFRLPFLRDIRRGWFTGGAESALRQAEQWGLKGSQAEEAARALERAIPGIRPIAKGLPWVGAAIDSGFAGWQQWQDDTAKNVPMDEKITNTVTTGLWTAGTSAAGGALLGSACAATGVGVILVAGCAAVGGYLGGKFGAWSAPAINDAANWTREQVTSGLHLAGEGLSAAEHGVESAVDWGKEHLCPWC